MKNAIALGMLALAAVSPNLASAQHYHNIGGRLYWHQNVPHYHDRAGHLVDRYGHHIDGDGRHTPYGVYEDGSISGPRMYSYYGGMSRPYLYAGPAYSPYSSYGYYSLGASPNNALPQSPSVSVSRPALLAKGVNWPSRGKITILNPTATGSEVNYSLNKSTYKIKPGYSQKFEDDRNWIVAFGSGGEKGDVRYTLTAGTYQFVATDAGWDLKRVKEPNPLFQSDVPPPPPSE
jgi:hypothetical protein